MDDGWMNELGITQRSWSLNPPELFRRWALLDLARFTESKETLSLEK